ncbi:TPA: hypothetical protein ACKP6Y_001648 [Pseudomonas aeruginosa]
MQQPPVITYNLKERGREHRGVKRSFDIPAIVKAINSPKCQERVRTRGMLGFFGHWPRLRFGLEPAEGGIAEGKAQAVEPAVVTVMLKAHSDGTIEHKTEFLDTSTGQLAARMYANRVGGFSSAIDPRAPEFYGFDWVNDPNYSTNRGYDLALDSVANGEMTLDDVLLAEYAEQTTGMNRLMSMLESNMQLALDTAARLERENSDLLDILSRKNAAGSADFTPATEGAFARLERDRRFFLDSAALPDFKSPEAAEKRKEDREYLQLASRVIQHV